MSVKRLLAERTAHCLKTGGPFVFSMTYSPEAIEEIKEMGEQFTSTFLYTVAPLPGMNMHIICINRKDPR